MRRLRSEQRVALMSTWQHQAPPPEPFITFSAPDKPRLYALRRNGRLLIPLFIVGAVTEREFREWRDSCSKLNKSDKFVEFDMKLNQLPKDPP